ncbi:Uncharacterised protein (plasmid) [Legionella adelaidensis]|uniref:Carboxymuconolactone decarboxylase n=1 Tax=Legionella adelaidensis TaxID=45056 RepID=A0A0W0R220_9GAMM|nr:hypothetical protein [Legionella adelaidensis]KTC65126.1 hypothetical protein Lade_1499 [Legionella adelaidensis]VEH85471.1 Uncharacterised protein [Legionella adelaidensis]
MSRIQLSNCGTTPFERLLGHAPEILDNWGKLESVFFQSSNFSPDFLEQVRRALAFNNQCQYCMAKAGPPDQNPNDARLIEALRFANKFAISHESIDDAEIARLKSYFSEAELLELTAFCSFISASQKIGAVMGLEEAEFYGK